jgi:hypothetical protein
MDANVDISVTPHADGKVRLKLDSGAWPGAVFATMDLATSVKIAAAVMDAAGVARLRVDDDGMYAAQTRNGAALEGRVNR